MESWWDGDEKKIKWFKLFFSLEPLCRRTYNLDEIRAPDENEKLNGCLFNESKGHTNNPMLGEVPWASRFGNYVHRTLSKWAHTMSAFCHYYALRVQDNLTGLDMFSTSSLWVRTTEHIAIRNIIDASSFCWHSINFFVNRTKPSQHNRSCTLWTTGTEEREQWCHPLGNVCEQTVIRIYCTAPETVDRGAIRRKRFQEQLSSINMRARRENFPMTFRISIRFYRRSCRPCMILVAKVRPPFRHWRITLYYDYPTSISKFEFPKASECPLEHPLSTTLLFHFIPKHSYIQNINWCYFNVVASLSAFMLLSNFSPASSTKIRYRQINRREELNKRQKS